MHLLTFYEMVENDNKKFNTLYVGVAINCNDGVVYYEPTDPRNWSYRFVNYFRTTPISAFSSTLADSGYSWAVTIWLDTEFDCAYIVDNYKPTYYTSTTVTLDEETILPDPKQEVY